jgi:hypothetical protein
MAIVIWMDKKFFLLCPLIYEKIEFKYNVNGDCDSECGEISSHEARNNGFQFI